MQITREKSEELKELLLKYFYNNCLWDNITENPNTPDWLLEYIYKKRSNHKYPHKITHLITGNPNTPSEILDNIAKNIDPTKYWNHPDPTVCNLVMNPNFLLKSLDKIKDVRGVTDILKINKSKEVFEILAESSCIDVLLVLLSYEEVPEGVLRKLTRHEYSAVRDAAVINPNCPIDILENSDWPYICENPNATEKSLLNQIDYYRGHKWFHYKILLKHKNCPVKYIEHMYKRLELDIREYIAKNPRTPLYILKHYSKSRRPSIKIRIINNPNTTLEILIGMLGKEQDHILQEKLVDELNNRGNFTEEQKKLVIKSLKRLNLIQDKIA